jgi:predicted DCC family thiol-disulfide oxidoreductase YuxK
VIFDGDCRFCRFWIGRWRARTGGAVDYEPLQSDLVRARFPELPRESLEEALHLVLTDGRVFSGAEAVLRALSRGAGGRGLVWCYEVLPGFAPASEAAYRLAARNRPFLSYCTRALWGLESGTPGFEVSTRWFLRGLGLIYVIAFWSLGIQLAALAGSHGLEPAQDLMRAARRELGGPGWRSVTLLPTLCWWNDSDGFLRFQWLAGASLGVCAVLGFFQGPVFLLLWVLYLSLVTVGGDFLGFQWDALLLEAGLLAVWLAPWKVWPRWKAPRSPPALIRRLFWWLLFRLMFLSGSVKLLSGDETWRNFTALDYHYQTQPLPTFLAWYAQRFPEVLQKVSLSLMFFIELALPFALVLPRRARHAAGLGFVALQLFIMLTGNYTFFNLLTIALVLLLFDDAFFRRPASAPAPAGAGTAKGRRRAALLLRGLWFATLVPAAVIIVMVTVWEMAGTFGHRGTRIPWAQELAVRASPFRSINSYGLFAVMTRRRDEIVIEGSADGSAWSEYEFPYKPGDVRRRPRFVAPYQPRLDWQMWFAALGSARQSGWFGALMTRLLQGTPEVLALLENNPFPRKPPLFVRAWLYEYRFTTAAERAAGEGWWHRDLESKRLYFRIFSLSMISDEK